MRAQQSIACAQRKHSQQPRAVKRSLMRPIFVEWRTGLGVHSATDVVIAHPFHWFRGGSG
jgi:hypothetical protein